MPNSRRTDGAGLEADQREAAIDQVLRTTRLGLSDLPMPKANAGTYTFPAKPSNSVGGR